MSDNTTPTPDEFMQKQSGKAVPSPDDFMQRVRTIETATALGTEKTLEERQKALERLSGRDPSMVRKGARALTQAIPFETAATGATLGGEVAGPYGAILGAIIGGAGGEAWKQLTEWLAKEEGTPKTSLEAAGRIAGQGVRQGEYEVIPQVAGPVISRAAKLLMPAPGEVAGEKVAAGGIRDLGQRLHLTSPEIGGARSPARLGREIQAASEVSHFGQVIAQKGKETATQEANNFADEVLNTLAARRSPFEAGKQVASGLQIAQDAFRERSELYYETLGNLGKDAPGDATEVISEAARLNGGRPRPLRSTELAGLSEAVRNAIEVENLGEIGDNLPQATPSAKILSVMGRLKPNPSFSEMLSARQWLGQFLPGETHELSDKEAQQYAKLFYGRLTDALDHAAEFNAEQTGSPALRNAWERAENFYKEGKEAYNDAIVRGLLQNSPEDLVKSIVPKEVTGVNMIKKALLGHGDLPEVSSLKIRQRYPMGMDPQRAWDVFRRQYVESNLLKQPEATTFDLESLWSLKNRMNNAGKSQLDAIFGDDAAGHEGEGRKVLENLRLLAETGSRIKPIYTGPWRRVTELMGISTTVGSGILAGLSGGLMAGSEKGAMAGAATVGAIEGPGYIVSKILYSPRATRLLTRGLELSAKGSAVGVGMVERAIAMAGTVDLSKPVHIDTPPVPKPAAGVPPPPQF